MRGAFLALGEDGLDGDGLDWMLLRAGVGIRTVSRDGTGCLEELAWFGDIHAFEEPCGPLSSPGSTYIMRLK